MHVSTHPIHQLLAVVLGSNEGRGCDTLSLGGQQISLRSPGTGLEVSILLLNPFSFKLWFELPRSFDELKDGQGMEWLLSILVQVCFGFLGLLVFRVQQRQMTATRVLLPLSSRRTAPGGDWGDFVLNFSKGVASDLDQ